MKTIRGFENEEIEVSDFGEWVGKDYIDYKSEYKNNQKLIKILLQENQELKKQLELYEAYFNRFFKINNKSYDGKVILNLLDKKESQQEEFIKYLEDKINYIQSSVVKLPVISSKRNYLVDLGNDLLRVLLKYKEIIGNGSDVTR